ncbi:hypothetical protein Q8F55_000551 [Vanrija albida]|uniref:Uncharacterized protein n=1 Tax=Vanrija albida TaxID=181172 RepID=A0ABR3QEH1_9TREE
MPPTPTPTPTPPSTLNTLTRRWGDNTRKMSPAQGKVLLAVFIPLFVIAAALRTWYEVDKRRRRQRAGPDEVRSTPFTRGELPASAWFARRAQEEPAPPVPAPPYSPREVVTPPPAAHLAPASPVGSLPAYAPPGADPAVTRP